MSRRKRRLLTALPAVAAVFIAVSVIVPQAFVSDPIRGALVGFFAGCSVVALIKLRGATPA